MARTTRSFRCGRVLPAESESSPTWSDRFAKSGDFLALERSLPAPQPGDLLAVMSAGAYGAVQSGTYNTRPLVPEVLVRKSEWAVVRPRVTAEELIALDHLPPWLS